MLGPIDYIAISFEGNDFDGSILSELSKAVDSGTIRVVDLLFIIKGLDGSVEAAEIKDQSEDLKKAAKALGMKGDMPLMTEDDIEKLGEKMDNDTAAGVLVIEHLWAKGLKKAIMNAGGTLAAEGRIHPGKVLAAVDELELETIKV